MSSAGVKDEISDCVEAFFDKVAELADKRGCDIPQTAVYTPTNFKREDPERIVAQPSKLVRVHRALNQFFFNDTAEWLVSSGNGFDFPPAIDPEQTEGIRTYYRKRLFEFAQIVLDYTGCLEFSESDFEEAYKDHIQPKYQSKHTHRIIVPLPGFSMHDADNLREEKLRLSTKINLGNVGRNQCELSPEIEISRLTEWELAGIQTHGSPHATTDLKDLKRRLSWYYKLTIDIDVEDLPTAHEKERPGIDRSWTSQLAKQVGIRVARQVRTVLRLFQPRGYVGIGPAYVMERSWLTHRGLCMDIGGYFSSSDSLETTLVKLEHYRLHREDHDDINSFWEGIASTCDPEADTRLSTAIRRFNQTFRDKSYEDKIVDCYIGFEKTLANDDRVSSFRFPARAVLLFQDQSLYLRNSSEMSAEFVYEFIDLLQNKRNGIIHDDAKLNMGDFEGDRDRPAELTVECLSSYEFTIEARYLLSQAIQSYQELLEKKDITIKEINRETIDPKIVNILTDV